MAKVTEMTRNPYKYGTGKWRVAEKLRQGKSRVETMRELFPLVGEVHSLTFSSNVMGGRVPKPRMEQYRIFIKLVSTVIKELENDGYTLDESYSDKRIWVERDSYAIAARRRFIFQLVDEGLIKDPNSLEFKNRGSGTAQAGAIVHPSGVKIVSATSGASGGGVTYQPTTIDPPQTFDPKAGQFQPDPHVLTDPEPTPEPEPEPEPKRTPAQQMEHELDLMLSDLYRARGYVVARELAGESLDFISTRAVDNSCRAVLHGIKRNELMHAITVTWPEDSKNEFKTWTELWKPTNHNAIDTDRYSSPLRNAHRVFGYVFTLAEARIPIMLVGPAGSGKSFMARDLAEAFEEKYGEQFAKEWEAKKGKKFDGVFPYGEVPLTAGATPSWLAGAQTMKGYVSRPFVDIYRDGGVFCFEEIDAADPNMLLLVNNALANESFFNPVTGEEILKSKFFIPCATANTWGIGANRMYTGRDRLDAATLDRFRVGRVEVDYDPTVERAIVDGYKDQIERHAHKKVKA
jgi:dynein-related subfamily AAA family protein